MITFALHLALLWIPVQDEGPAFTRFQFAREKTANKVTADAELHNTLQEELKSLRVVVIFYSCGEEIRRSDPKAIARLAAGKSAKLLIETLRVARFDAYEVILWHADGKLIYEGKEFDRPPVLKEATPAVIEMVDHGDRGPERFPGNAAIRFVVRNTGESTAREPVALLDFKDADGARVFLKRVHLPGPIPPFVEQTFEMTVPGVPEYASVTPTIVWLSSLLVSMEDPPGEPQGVEPRNCRILLLTDGSVRISGRVLNGFDKPVDRIQITFKLGKTKCPIAIQGAIPPGEERTFESFITDLAEFKQTAFSVSYEDGKKGAEEAKEVPRLTATRVASKELERDTEPPPPVARGGGARNAAEAAARNILRAEITGIHWIKGIQIKNTYTGDIGFLKLRFTDGRGKTVQPTGSLSVAIFNGNEPYRRVPRNINSASWGHDLTKLTIRNASHQLVGCNPDSGEAWAGIVHDQGQFHTLRLQVSLKLRGKGSWVWKDLEAPFTTSPREADKK